MASRPSLRTPVRRLSTLMRLARPGCRMGGPTFSPDPDLFPCTAAARFSPDDKFSKQRLICKKRFGLLPMQQPKPQL